MLIKVLTNGTTQNILPENIYQGSADANTIYVLAPFSANVSAGISFEIEQSGETTQEFLLEPPREINDSLNCWQIKVDKVLTQYYGSVKYQIRFFTGGTIIGYGRGKFQVIEGVDRILPDSPDETVYDAILDELRLIKENLVLNGWYTSRAFQKYNSQRAYQMHDMTYDTVDNIVYLYRSKINDNMGNLLTDTDSWEQISIDSALWGKISGNIQEQTDLIEYIKENGGKIDTISVNGANIAIDENKNVNIAIPTKLSEFNNDTGFIINTVSNLTNYYLKNETYTKQEVLNLIGNISTITMQVVDQLPSVGETNVIYLVPAENPTQENERDEFIYINGEWEKIGSTSIEIDLSQYATKQYVDNQDIAFIGKEQQVDFNATLENNQIIARLDSSIADFDFTTNTAYQVHIYLPLVTVTGDLDNSYPIYLRDKNGNNIYINTIFEDRLGSTSTVGNLCQIQNYDVGVGYSWEFNGHYREINNAGTLVRTVYVDTVVRETNPSMTGEDFHNALINSKLKVGTTALVTIDYNQNGFSYKAGHTYLITGDTSSGELILDTIDITPSGTGGGTTVIIRRTT